MSNFKNLTRQIFNRSSGYILVAILALQSSAMHAAGINGDVAPRGAPDGLLDIKDVNLVQDFINGTQTPTVQEYHIADIAPNGAPDGQLTFDDVVLLGQAIQGLENIDTIPPDPLPLNKTTVSYTKISNSLGFATVNVSANTIETQARVTATNLRTSENSSTTVDESGQFSLSVAAKEGDSLSIVLADATGNVGSPVTVNALQNPATTGPYPVGWVELDDPNGISGITDPDGIMGPTHNVSLAWAKIMYPAQTAVQGAPVNSSLSTIPVVLFLHGNNSNCDLDGNGPSKTDVSATTCPGDAVAGISSDQQRVPTHEGFEYLMKGLASHGIFSISVSAHELQANNRDPWAIPARGRLVLAFLDKIREWSSNSQETDFGGLFTGRLDMSKIGLSGHSRGGYGVIAAQQINATRLSPLIPHNIVAVNTIAPAPVKSTEDPYIITEAPYFLLLGARDGDGNNAFASYDDAYAVGGSALHPKMAAHVYGANHNYFNEITTDTGTNPWAGAKDEGLPYNSSDVMTASTQRQIALTSIVAFFRWHLQGLNAYREVFTGRHRFPAFVNDKVYWSFQDAGRKVVDSFEDIETRPLFSTPPGAFINHTGFSRFEQCSPLWWGFQVPTGGLFYSLTNCFGDPLLSNDFTNFGHIAHRTGGLALAWDNPNTLTIDYPIENAIDIRTYKYLSFRATKRSANIPGESTAPINLFVNIEDINGNTAIWDLRSDQYGLIPHPFQRSGFIESGSITIPLHGNRSQLSTVRIPLNHFTLYGSNVNLQQISRIIIKTEGAAQMAIDDIEFGN